MHTTPSYLGLLNAIAVGELGGETLFRAWSSATADADVRSVVDTVALREAEHARSFAKRINELGFSVRDRADPDLARRVDIAASSAVCDREKFELLGFAKEPAPGPDFFARFFDDTSIDIQSGELLGRYISEERDTGRRLRACHAMLCAREPAPVSSSTTRAADELSERLSRIEATLVAVTETLAARAGAAPEAAGTPKAKPVKQR